MSSALTRDDNTVAFSNEYIYIAKKYGSHLNMKLRRNSFPSLNVFIKIIHMSKPGLIDHLNRKRYVNTCKMNTLQLTSRITNILTSINGEK